MQIQHILSLNLRQYLPCRTGGHDLQAVRKLPQIADLFRALGLQRFIPCLAADGAFLLLGNAAPYGSVPVGIPKRAGKQRPVGPFSCHPGAVHLRFRSDGPGGGHHLVGRLPVPYRHHFFAAVFLFHQFIIFRCQAMAGLQHDKINPGFLVRPVGHGGAFPCLHLVACVVGHQDVLPGIVRLVVL